MGIFLKLYTSGFKFKCLQVLSVHTYEPLKNNFKLMSKNFDDCLFVLKNVECFMNVYFIPTKLLKAYGVCSIQNKFV